MVICLLLRAILNLSLVVSLAMSSSVWPLSDELFAPETDFSLNDGLLAFDQSISSMKFNVLPQDGSDLFFGEQENSGSVSTDDNDLGGLFELAGCSTVVRIILRLWQTANETA